MPATGREGDRPASKGVCRALGGNSTIRLRGRNWAEPLHLRFHMDCLGEAIDAPSCR